MSDASPAPASPPATAGGSSGTSTPVHSGEADAGGADGSARGHPSSGVGGAEASGGAGAADARSERLGDAAATDAAATGAPATGAPATDAAATDAVATDAAATDAAATDAAATDAAATVVERLNGPVRRGVPAPPTFKFRCVATEEHGREIYAVECCPFEGEYADYLATAGSNRITIYRMTEEGSMEPVQVYVDSDTTEDLWALAWSVDETVGDPLIAAAGKAGLIKLLNCSTGTIVRTMQGHGNAINQLRFHPVDRRLLLSASKDESLRLWNIENGVCAVVFAGDQGHRDEVLCCDIHPLGNCFISAGMDNSLKIWALDNELVRETVAAAAAHTGPASGFHTRFEQFPAFSTRKVHDNYIDYAGWVGNFVISKSTGNKLVMWCPDVRREKDAVTVLREFTFADCDIWFVRAGMDGSRRLLSVGNKSGKVFVWWVDAAGRAGPTAAQKATILTTAGQHSTAATTVRQTALSMDGRYLIAVTDSSRVWRWDRTSEEPDWEAVAPPAE